MNCAQAKYYISHYKNIKLQSKKKQELQEHIPMCASCRKYAEALQRQRAIIQRAVHNAPFPKSLPEEVLVRISLNHKTKILNRLKIIPILLYNHYKPIIASAAVILISIISVFIFFLMNNRSEGKLVNISGEVICLSCELRKNYNAPCDCTHSGHKYAIRTKNGKYLMFSCSKNTINLSQEEMRGCRIEAVGYLYQKEHYVHIIAVNSIKKNPPPN